MEYYLSLGGRTFLNLYYIIFKLITERFIFSSTLYFRTYVFIVLSKYKLFPVNTFALVGYAYK